MAYTMRFNDAEAQELKTRATVAKQSIPDYIRAQLFPQIATTVTVTETIRRALSKSSGTEFTVPELYLQSEYAGINRGVAGSVGRDFNRQVLNSYSADIVSIGKRNRQALYRRI